MPNPYREVRLKERADVATFVAGGGTTVTPGACLHDASHTLSEDDAVVAAAVAYREEEDHQNAVALHVVEPATPETAKDLLDLTLMKLHEFGVVTVRVHTEDAVQKALDEATDWQHGLPTYEKTGHELDWLIQLRENQPDAAKVVDRALAKVAREVGALFEDEASNPESEASKADSSEASAGDAKPGSPDNA